MKVAESVVKMLEDMGVNALFTGSGQGCADLLFALADSKQIKTVMTRHEQAAAFMAYGYAVASGNLGVCNAQGGPGSSNLFSGVGMASTGGIPLLSISSYAPKKCRGKGDLGEMTGLFGTPDSYAMFSATTKKTFIIDSPEDTCDIFEEAVNLAFELPQGPVHINLPYDVAGMENKNHRVINVVKNKPMPNSDEVSACANLLCDAVDKGEKVLLWIGNGCVRSGAAEEIKLLVDTYKIPFVFTMDGKGLIPDIHPLCMGMVGVCGDISAKQAIAEANIVVAIGCSFAKWQSWQFENTLFESKKLVVINWNKSAINRVYTADYAVVADIKPAVKSIFELMQIRIPKVSDTVSQNPLNVHGKTYQCLEICDNSDKIHPATLAMQIGRMLPNNALLLGDAGSHMIWLAAYAQLNDGQSYKNPGSFGPMASHTNAAIGYQLGAPDRRVIVGCGDGCYQMAGFELMTAIQEKIPIIWIIFNNSEFNIIKTFNLKLTGKEVFNHIEGPNFAEYAKLCGANGYRVTKLEQFKTAFAHALESDIATVIDVIVDSDSVIPFSDF